MMSGLPASLIPDRVAVQLSQQEQQESQSRSFAYATGPAYALLLDMTGANWRKSIKSSSDLASRAALAWRITDTRSEDAQSRVAVYSGERMIASEAIRETNRIAQEAKLRARFLEGPSLTLPIGSLFNFSFDPNGAVPLAGLGTVYESSRISDEWGTLDVKSGGVLIRRNEKGLITGVIVSTPIKKDNAVEVEGWQLKLSPGWTVVESQAKLGQLTVRKE